MSDSATPSPSGDTHSTLTRRNFLKTAAAAGAALAAPGLLGLTAQAAAGIAQRRNLIFFLNDQERASQWFPAGWEEANLPGLMRLRRTGVTFSNACVNTAMCTPSRSTIFTGLYPTQSGCTDTLTEGFAQSATETQLNPNLPNLATILGEQGYDVYYKGKWHLHSPVHDANGNVIHGDIDRYGFQGWNPPDAGQDTKIENYGGGDADNDTRYVDDALAFLQDRIDNPNPRPFCLIISLVNPHDVLGYPGNRDQPDPGDAHDYTWSGGGYDSSDFQGTLGLPPTVDENLANNFKPTAHASYKQLLLGLGILGTEQRQRNYLNFYANLIKLNDEKLVQVLDLLDGSVAGRAIRNNSWIVRTSDHGELGMSHGGLRQKAFQCYEESLRVPLIWSNPVDFPDGTGKVCEHLVSHVDFIPTVCALSGISDWRRRFSLPGVEYSSLLRAPLAARGVQDYIYFTYDDIYAAANAATFPDGSVPPPNRLEAIRTRDFKYVRYWDGNGVEPDQEEFYDLRTAAKGGTDCDAATGQPVELINYSNWAQAQRGANPIAIPTVVAQQKTALLRLLTTARRRLLSIDPGPVDVSPEVTPTVVDVSGVPALELFWYSLATTEYQLQRSTGGGSWQDVDAPIAGNNGPIMVVINNYDANDNYRIESYPAA